MNKDFWSFKRKLKQKDSMEVVKDNENGTKANGGTNGTAPGEARDVGAKVKVGVEDVATLVAADQIAAEHQKKLGQLRLQYLSQEQQIVQAVQKATNDYYTLLNMVAKKKGLTSETEKWTFDQKEGVFTRTA